MVNKRYRKDSFLSSPRSGENLKGSPVVNKILKQLTPERIEEKKKLDSIFKKIAKKVDPIIKELLSSYLNGRNKKIANYQILTGGKRVRPALAILGCQLVGGKVKDALYPAAGLEILHNYSLIVDDIIDHGSFRRGKETSWFKFGKSVVQCIEVAYPAAAFQAANRSKYPVLISELFAKTMKEVISGEILDLLFEQRGREDESFITKNRYLNITNKNYLEMVSKKTASLFQTCCEIGGICAGNKKREVEALKNYGFNLGIAFQVRDDVLDIFGEEKKLGKKIGKDIKERKLGNLAILFALKEFSPSQKEKFLRIMRKRQITDRNLKEAMGLIKRTKSYQKTYSFGQKYINRAKESLKVLPQNKWNSILKELADFTIERER